MEIRISNNRTKEIVATALMMSLIIIGTMLFKIPVPMTQGYVHLGDAMIYLSVLLLGRRNGTAAASLGSALGDIIGGYAFWAPWTLVIKALMAFVTATLIERRGANRVLAMAAGGIVMCLGYLAAECIIYGNLSTAFIALPWNIMQFSVGIAAAMLINKSIKRKA